MKLDHYDRKILQYLQENGRISNQELAEYVNLTPAPCLRRVKRLEQEGYLSHYAGIASRQHLGLKVIAFTQISLKQHDAKSIATFDEFVATNPHVMECYSIAGDHDYLLKVLARDIEEVEQFLLQKLMKQNFISSANTTFVLREHKHTTVLPM